MKNQTRQTLRSGEWICMPYTTRATAKTPAGTQIFTCLVVCLKNEQGANVPYLRSDQFGTYWFEPRVHPQGGYDYKMVSARNVPALEKAFLSKRKRTA